MVTTPSFSDDELLACVRGELSPDAAERMKRLAAVDATLARRLAMIGLVRATIEEAPAVRPPAEALARARAIARPRPSLVDRAIAAADRAAVTIAEAVATLVFDSASAPAAVGVRGGQSGRHLTFAAGDVEIDLLVDARPGADTATVTGQIDPAGPASVRALGPAGDPAASALADPRGVFTLKVRPGRYDVRIDIGGRSIRLAGVPLEV